MPQKVVTINENGIAHPYSIHLSRSNGDTVVWRAAGNGAWVVKFGQRRPFDSVTFEVRSNEPSDEAVLQPDAAPGGYDYIVEPAGQSGSGTDPRIEIV
jgi:hypothetical protein